MTGRTWMQGDGSLAVLRGGALGQLRLITCVPPTASGSSRGYRSYELVGFRVARMITP